MWYLIVSIPDLRRLSLTVEYFDGVGKTVQYHVKLVLFSQTYVNFIRSSAAV